MSDETKNKWLIYVIIILLFANLTVVAKCYSMQEQIVSDIKSSVKKIDSRLREIERSTSDIEDQLLDCIIIR